MKRTNKIISLVVTLAIILSSMIFVVPTAAEEAAPAFESWTVADAGTSLSGSGTAEDPYVANLEGSGTEEDPYLIGSVQDFIAYIMAANCVGKNGDQIAACPFAAPDKVYKLTADIDLSAKNWAFGTSAYEYRNELNGDGKTITVAFMNPAAGAHQSLFGTLRTTDAYFHDFDFIATWKVTRTAQAQYLATFATRTYGAVIENMNVSLDIDVVYNGVGSTTGFDGGFIGYATWANTNQPNTQITNVNFTGTVNISTINTGAKVNSSMKWGGLVGRSTGVDFVDCVFDFDMTVKRARDPDTSKDNQNGTVNRVGGIVAYYEYGGADQVMKFENCVNKCDFTWIDGSNNGGRVGSWVGTNDSNGNASGVKLKFINCVDQTTWTGSTNGGAFASKHAVVGRNESGKFPTDGLVFEGFFSTGATLIGQGMTSHVEENVLTGVDALYLDNGDTIDVYMNLPIWNAFVEEIYPVYAAVAFNGEENTDPTYDEDLNVVIFTFEKGDAEEGTLPEIVYYSVATGDVVSTIVITDNEVDWTTFRAAEFENGPYVAGQEIEIATAAQLALLAYMSNNGTDFAGSTIKLTADIDLAGYEWVQIWQNHNGGFAGKIDGQGFEIKNLTLTADSYVYGAGFIGRTAPGFEIKNVTFVDPVIAAGRVNGSINAAATVVTAFYGGLIDGVTVTGLDLNVATERMGYTGGIVGYIGHHTATIKNSSASGRIYGVAVNDSMIGGLVARPRYGFIDNCVSKVDIDVELGLDWSQSENKVKDENGTVLGTGVKYSHVTVTIGGITGEVNAYVAELTRITNCTNNGDINVKITNNSTYAWVGGIVGAATTPGILVIEDCQNNGSITIDDANMEVVIPELGEFDAFGTESCNVIGAVLGSNKCSTIINDTTSIVDAEVVGQELNASMIDGLEVLAGARVRIDTTNGLLNSGLRFDAKVNKAVYEGIHGKKDSGQHNKADHTNAAITLGMMIVPVEMVGEKTAAELYADENILKVDLTKGFYNVDSNGDAYFSAAIINLKEANYEREFVAITYMNIQSAWVISSCVVFGDINLDNARSAADVASKALADATAGYTSEQIAVLQQYVA